MDQTVIDDLKQFISATISQQTADLTTKTDLKAVERKIDSIQAAITATIIPYVDTVDEQVQDHETRLVTLETKPA